MIRHMAVRIELTNLEKISKFGENETSKFLETLEVHPIKQKEKKEEIKKKNYL